jgi:hypothetical protein
MDTLPSTNEKNKKEKSLPLPANPNLAEAWYQPATVFPPTSWGENETAENAEAAPNKRANVQLLEVKIAPSSSVNLRNLGVKQKMKVY